MMMRDFQLEFIARKKHLRRYMAIVAKNERQSAPFRTSTTEMSLNVLRAGTFLIVYNLMESSIRTAVQAIHDELIGSQVEFQHLVFPLKKEIVKGFKKHAKATFSNK